MAANQADENICPACQDATSAAELIDERLQEARNRIEDLDYLKKLSADAKMEAESLVRHL
jgi:hypothetical protein